MAFRQVSFEDAEELARFVTSGKNVTAAAVVAGGNNYTLNDLLTVVGGDASGGQKAVLKVTGVGGGGAVTTVSVLYDGIYLTVPTNPVSTTGGTGSGATFNLTTAALVAPSSLVKTLWHNGRWYQFWFA